jgi:glycerol-3-phosphate acyltransferase PlsY
METFICVVLVILGVMYLIGSVMGLWLIKVAKDNSKELETQDNSHAS